MSDEIDILTPRRQQILDAVVREYIETATPVGSKTAARYLDLGISPATIRNEMAYLEEHGYLTHPHTSAGRVPTEKGYRYFVQRLMQDVQLPLEEQRMIVHQFYQAQLDLEEWMRLAATALAHAARGAAVVVPPRIRRCRFKHLELISTHGNLVLLVLVLYNGLVKQQMLSLTQVRSQSDLSRVSRWLNDLFADRAAEEMRPQLDTLPQFEREIAETVIQMMEEIDEQREPAYRDGLINVLTQPEFEHSPDQVLTLFSQGGPLDVALADILDRTLNGPSVQIFIGGEGRYRELSNFSLVLSRYGVNGLISGALGVVGPLRMPYARTVSAVRFVSWLLTRLMYDYYGELPEAIVEE